MSSPTTELLEQFILEAREVLERIGQRLLAIERQPEDGELLADLFRLVHTLKGNCGLFDFQPLEQIVHAGEDLLDRIRHGEMAYTHEVADALLDAMDHAGELIEAIAATGSLPPGGEARAAVHAQALRRALAAAPAAAALPRGASPDPALPAPDAWPGWAQALPAAERERLRREGGVLLRYQPEPECFFKGEDPWRHARLTPGLRHLHTAARGPWPAPEAFDCYRCSLDLVVASDAAPATVQDHYRCVPEQVELRVIPPSGAAAAPAPAGEATRPAVPAAHPAAVAGAPAAAPEAADPAAALVRERALRLWDEQRSLLARPGVAAGTVAAVRLTLARLLEPAGGDPAARAALDALPPGALPLATWAAQHAPAGSATAGHAGAPGAAAPAAAPEARRGGAEALEGQKVLKVAQDKIDRLMDLIGEMVVAKNALPYLADRAEGVFGQRELAREIKTQYSVINRIAEDMQHAIMQVRMLPVGTVFQRFGRLVRDLSRRLGKDVALVLEGEDTEADKNIIESLADPLIHILRNSLDHGLEPPEVRRAAGKPAQGTLRVSARQEGDRVLLEIADDGAGIDTDRVRAKAVERGLIPADRAELLSEAEAVQLVFLPGFSTAEAISDLSGRGVGMDVVRSAVERINGSVHLASRRGQGTTLRLTLPLSMAVTNVMMIEAAGTRFGVPMDLIVETVRVAAEDIHRFKQAQTVVLRGRIVPLRALAELLALTEPPRLNADGEHAVLVVRLGAETLGLLVDDFHGTRDIILKPLDGVLAGLTGFAGTALMGDGSVLMILNPKELV